MCLWVWIHAVKNKQCLCIINDCILPQFIFSMWKIEPNDNIRDLVYFLSGAVH